jgi:hypothetical protein
MNPDFQRLMQDATRLTRSGDLQAATAAIQAALGGGTAEPSSAPGYPALPGSIVIDVDAANCLPKRRTATRSKRAASSSPVAGAAANAARDYKLYVPPNAGDARCPWW